jgi:hypothetical protein
VRGLIAGLVGTLVIGLGVLAALTLRPTPAPLTPAQARLARAGVALALPAEAQVLRAEEEAGRLQTALLSVGSDQLRLRITEGLDAAGAAARVEEVRQVMDNLFEDRQAPYPGQLSNTLRCPDEYRPTPVEPRGEALAMVGLYANERLAFGGCSEDLLRYRATVGFFYDPSSRRLLRVEYFAALDAPDAGPDLLRSLTLAAGSPTPTTGG